MCLTHSCALHHNDVITAHLLGDLGEFVLESRLCLLLILQLLVQPLRLILEVLVLVAHVDLGPCLLRKTFLYETQTGCNDAMKFLQHPVARARTVPPNQLALNSALRLAHKVDAVVTGSSKNLEKCSIDRFQRIFSLWQLEGKGSCDVDIVQSAGSMVM